jgi:cystathionine beta-lyase/cystathionine gamma-synthase
VAGFNAPNPLNTQFNDVMASISNQCDSYISSVGTSASKRRRALLQAGDAIRITSEVYVETPPDVQAAVLAAYTSGELVEKLAALGLTLEHGTLG